MKRHLIEQGLIVLMRAGLAEVEAGENGLAYRASEEGPGFVDILAAPYTDQLKDRAAWVITAHASPGMDVRAAAREITDRWARDFASHQPFPGE